jgi:hypothetical protein
MFLRCCIISNPLVLVLIMICYIFSYLGSSSSNYINIFLIIYSFYGNRLNILVILIPFLLHFCQKYRTFFCSMIYCVIVHACFWWLWTIPFIMSKLLEIVTGYWSSASSKCSSSMFSSSKSSYVSLIVCARCIILWYLIVFWWCCKLLCIIILSHRWTFH